jgi:hypothetical protein
MKRERLGQYSQYGLVAVGASVALLAVAASWRAVERSTVRPTQIMRNNGQRDTLKVRVAPL